jgi:DNA-3-methyladenine glycosylase II
LADKFLDKTVEPKHFSTMTNAQITEHLTQVKGIGNWTADMFLIFALNRQNVLPVGDLGIRKGFQKVFNLKKLPSERHMLKLSKPHGHQLTNLSLFLWESLDKN